MVFLGEVLRQKVVGRKIERVGFDFGVHKPDSHLNIHVEAVEPMPVVPHMEVLLILHEHQLTKLQLGQYHIVGVALPIELTHEPLSETPYTVGFWITF